jgi:fibronectin type 3 domain-containing protein
MEYKLDDADYVAYDATVFAGLDFSGNHTLLVRYAAAGINPVGPDTTLTFTMDIPDIPANVRTTVISYNSVQVDWDEVDEVDGYEVERKLWSTGVYSVIGTPTTNSLLSTGLTPNKTYYFRVRAYRMNGLDKVYSPYSAVKTATPGPAAPTGVKATVATYNSVNVTWVAAAGATGYEVERKLWSSGVYSVIETTATTSITSSGLALNKTYYFRIRAYKMVGETKVYSPYSAVVNATPGPAAPTGVRAVSASYNGINVTWTAATGAAGYEIERKLWSTGAYSVVATTTETSTMSTGLATNKTYYFRIRAYKMVGESKVYSPYSAVVSATPIPSAPTDVKTTILTPTSAQISWTAVSGASGYVVERKLWSTGVYTVVATTTATSLTNTGLATNKTYYYRVRAYRMVGTTTVYSMYSSVVPATPK